MKKLSVLIFRNITQSFSSIFSFIFCHFSIILNKFSLFSLLKLSLKYIQTKYFSELAGRLVSGLYIKTFSKQHDKIYNI